MFIGPKINTVFKSRWKALAWAAGVLFSAYCFVPSPDKDDNSDPGAINLPIIGRLGGDKPAPPPVSPWAPDKPQPTASSTDSQ